MSWKKLDYLIEERKKVIPSIVKNLSLINQQKPQADDILSPEHPHVQHHDEDYCPPTIINNVPVNFDHADEPTIPYKSNAEEQHSEISENDTNSTDSTTIEPVNNEVSNQDISSTDSDIVEPVNNDGSNDNQNIQNNQQDLTNNNNLLFI